MEKPRRYRTYGLRVGGMKVHGKATDRKQTTLTGFYLDLSEEARFNASAQRERLKEHDKRKHGQNGGWHTFQTP
jgi:hypothetical protein